MAKAKLAASLSLDLDNQWSYMRTHGDAGWDDYPSYLAQVLPLALQSLSTHGMTATIFLVGRDAAEPEHKALLAEIPRQGHEVGNHSYNHLQWLHKLPRPELAREIIDAEEAIAAATGVRPRGFRGPGFACGRTLLQILAERGYEYDCSTFPTFVGPLARAYYFMTARKLSQQEQEEREDLFGGVRDGLRPLRSYLWDLSRLPGTSGPSELLEIPVTTMPGVRTPIHMSYILYLAQRSTWLALRYLDTALRLCERGGLGPSFLLHPLDFISGDSCSALRFFPAMAMPAARKLELVGQALTMLRERFEVVPMGEHARRLRADSTLRRQSPTDLAP